MGKIKNKEKSVKQSKLQALTSKNRRNRKTILSDSLPMHVHSGKKEEKPKGKDTLNELKKYPFLLIINNT